MSIQKGNNIKVDYTGIFDDGMVFDSSKHGDHSHPLEFEVGSGQLIKGFDDAVMGMKKGETKKVKIAPKDAYGEHNPELTKNIPKSQLPAGQDPKPGMSLIVKSPEGQQIPLRIADVTGTDIVVDLNHPLAGKPLNFEITILEIEKPKKAE